jgi:BirA family biotin operon repressor/biotin-[acetyl-CoA-carboxylase] ligase
MSHAMNSHTLDAQVIAAGLKTRRVGRALTVLPEIDSTNAYALDRLAVELGSASDGHVVFAEYQSAGRGRLGRTWLCPRGAGLTFTVLLWEAPRDWRPARPIMAAALAVARGIEKSTEVHAVIRWPNDIFIGEKKVAGILVEARACGDQPMPVAVGIGVNCLQHSAHLPPHLRDKATSLEIESRHAVDRAAVARALLGELDRVFSSASDASDSKLAAAWREKSADVGRRISVVRDGRSYTGHVLDVHPQSGLLLQLDDGHRREFDPATVTRL